MDLVWQMVSDLSLHTLPSLWWLSVMSLGIWPGR